MSACSLGNISCLSRWCYNKGAHINLLQNNSNTHRPSTASGLRDIRITKYRWGGLSLLAICEINSTSAPKSRKVLKPTSREPKIKRTGYLTPALNPKTCSGRCAPLYGGPSCSESKTVPAAVDLRQSVSFTFLFARFLRAKTYKSIRQPRERAMDRPNKIPGWVGGKIKNSSI